MGCSNDLKADDKKNDLKNNFIIGKITVEDDDDKHLRIINSYEEYIRCGKESGNKNLLDEIEANKNENEIKENIEIEINNKKIPFNYFFDFEEKGIYSIKYKFKKPIKNMSHLFDNCRHILNLDFSNFYSQNVTNMSYLFKSCSKLESINFSNFNTQNVTDMSGMFEFVVFMKWIYLILILKMLLI